VRSTKSAITEREFMNRAQMELTIKRVSIVLAAVTILSAGPALSQAANQAGQPCPGTATVGAGEQVSNSADNPASEQGVENSAILPEAGGEDSAAPTIKNRRTNFLAQPRGLETRSRLVPSAGGISLS